MMITDRGVIDDVCRRFDLGTPRAAPTPVAGGLSNRLYRLVTDRGEFAVKRMVSNADAPDFKRNVEAAFAVELQAQAAGIPMPEPIPVAGSNDALARIAEDGNPSWVRVHRWVEGVPIEPSALEPGDRAEVGTILAALHRLPITSAATAPQPVFSMPVRDWSMALAGRPAASELAHVIPALETIVRHGSARPRRQPVLSHRDLDAKNLLRDIRGRLILLDWDAAGSTDAQWDAVGVAFDWSGVWQGAVSPGAFAETLDAYAAAGGRPHPITSESFAGWAEGMLGWLWFNLERSGSPDERERSLGNAEVAVMARLLPTAANWIARYP